MRQTIYRWYDLYAAGGFEALADRPSRPESSWNRIPEAVPFPVIINWIKTDDDWKVACSAITDGQGLDLNRSELNREEGFGRRWY
jgi:hypothetical protein